jgi:tRNA threonylcarbamoyladenosine modification (KEOPS) complex  Pcc1 subunit
MSNRHRLSIEVQDETVRRAVGPETEPDATEDRSESRLDEDGVVVLSSDLRSVRAALNGWVRLVSVAEETESVGR